MHEYKSDALKSKYYCYQMGKRPTEMVYPYTEVHFAPFIPLLA